MNSSLLLTGIGLRAPHYADILAKRPGVAWLEVHSENFFGEGKPLAMLEKIRKDYPISLHGVGLSLGSFDELNWRHLKKLRDLMSRIQPCLVSDHLSWSSFNGQYFHDLLPLPYTEETIEHLVARIQQVQDYLHCRLLIENVASYVNFTCSTMPEEAFLTAIATRSGCGILLDINNIYVSSRNLHFDPIQYLAAIPAGLVHEIHLGGFTTSLIDNKDILIDSHDQPVAPAVWDLYRAAIHQLGRKPTIIEWDTHLPPLESLCLEAFRAEKIMRETYVPTKLTG